MQKPTQTLKKSRGPRAIAILCLAAAPAFAHLENLNIKGGETFRAGQQVNITFEVGHFHNRGIAIHFARLGDNRWSLVTQLADDRDGQRSYTWTVPDSATTAGKLRVWQMDQPSSNTQNGYNLITGAFTITPATPILALRRNRATEAPALRLIPAGSLGQRGFGVLADGRMPKPL